MNDRRRTDEFCQRWTRARIRQDRRPAGDKRKLNIQPLQAAAALYRAATAAARLAALVALVVAALTTLVVPIAVRRMIDFGFSAKRGGADRQLFQRDDRGGGRARDLERAALLPRHHAGRAHRRRSARRRVRASHQAVAGFFDTAKTGEMVSRLTADTTQIKSAVGSSVSVALRNLVLFFGGAAMMVVTSPKLSLFVLAAIPVIVLPLVGFGRAVRKRSRAAQDTLADASGYASELIGAVRTLQAFTNELLATRRFGAAVEQRLRSGARRDPGALDPDRDRDLPDFLQRRRRAVGRRAGCDGRRRSRPAGSASSCSTRCSRPAGSAN